MSTSKLSVKRDEIRNAGVVVVVGGGGGWGGELAMDNISSSGMT